LCNEELCEGFNATAAAILKNIVKELDPLGNRPVSAAMDGDYGSKFSDVLDLVGINYHTYMYVSYHKSHPTQKLIGSEVSSAFTDRGVYFTSPTVKCVSAYDVNYPVWGELAELAMEADWVNDFIAGGFAWVGFDYKGEPTPYDWPNINSHFGLIDIAGFPKDAFYYYQSVWIPSKPLVHLFPHWNWEGSTQPVQVWVYSNAFSIELILNGKSLGTQQIATKASPMGRVWKSHVQWSVPFQSGNLTAVGYDAKGGMIASDSRITTGEGKSIALSVEFPSNGRLKANGVDVALVTCSILDVSGMFVATAGVQVQFVLAGQGSIIGLGNGDPNCHEHDKPTDSQHGHRITFNGLARVVLQSSDQAGKITLTASAPGLTSHQIVIPVLTAE